MISDVLGSRSLTTEQGLQSNNKPQGKQEAEQGSFASFASDRANETKLAARSKPQTGSAETQQPQLVDSEASAGEPSAALPQTVMPQTAAQLPVWSQGAVPGVDAKAGLDFQAIAHTTSLNVGLDKGQNTPLNTTLTTALNTSQAVAQVQGLSQNSAQATTQSMSVNTQQLLSAASQTSHLTATVQSQAALLALMNHSGSAVAKAERSGISFSDALMPSSSAPSGALAPAAGFDQDKAFAQQLWSNGIGATTKESSMLTPMAQGLAQQAIGSTVLADSSDNQTQLFTQMLARGATAPSVSQWGPVPVNMAGSLTQQAQDMLTPLREQLRFQIDQKIKHAEIRLDPPELGKLELNIRLDGDKLQIQMHAANPAVREALLSGLDRLRADLGQEYGGSLDVDVGQGDSPDKHKPQQQQTTVIAVNAERNGLESKLQTTSSDQQLNLLA
jgi:flagellar hook-length control protein FliK